MLAVSQVTDTAETMSLNNALEALTFRGADNVDKLAFLEDVDRKHLTIFLLVAFLKAGELGKMLLGSRVGLGKWPFMGLLVRLSFFSPNAS